MSRLWGARPGAATVDAPGGGRLAAGWGAPRRRSPEEVAQGSTVGIDVAKRAHEAGFLADDRRALGPPLRFATTRAGVARLLERIAALPGPVTAALESTGAYRLALHDALVGAGLAVRVRNPLQPHAFRRTGIRPAKTDRRDARVIADVMRVGRARAAYVPDDVILPLRELTRFRWGLVDRVGDAKRQVLTLLDRVFPEFPGLFSDPFVRGAQALLREAASAAECATADLDALTAVLRRASRGHLGAERAATVQAAAQDSLGVTRLGAAARFELQALLDQIALLEAQVAAEREIGAVLAGAPGGAGQHRRHGRHLATVPGLSTVLAASVLAEVGDVRRFPRLEGLVAYAGLDPTVHRSGEFVARQARLSKRGSPHLRRALWLAAVTAARCAPGLGGYYQRRLREGKPKGVVLGAVAHKLLGRIYTVLKQDRPYEARCPRSTGLDTP
jgi:transposase